MLLLSIDLSPLSNLRKNSGNRRTSGRPRQLRHRVGRNASTSTANPLNRLTAVVGVAAVGSVGRKKTLVVVQALGEVTAEVGGLLETAGDVVGTKGTETVVGVADWGLGAGLGGLLDDEGAALNGVDHDEAGLEHGVGRPGAEEGDDAATLELVVLGVDVEEAGLADAVTGGVLCDGADVPDIEAVAVVGLVEHVVLDVLVVINGAELASERS